MNDRGVARWLTVTVLTACSAPASPGAPRAVEVLPDVPYALLDHDQRARFMKERVVPDMTPRFRAHDAVRYRDFGCPTCHGPAANRGVFALPNPALPKLDLLELGRHDRRAVQWMTEVILPAIQTLVEDRSLDCLTCHPRA